MKFKKKNILAIGAAVMMTASLATIASAATNAPANIPNDTGVASVQAVDVDLSSIDFSKLQEGELVAIGTIDPSDVNGSNITLARPTEMGVASVVEADVDLSSIDFSKLQEGELVAIGTVDPSMVSGSFTTQSK